MNKSLLLFIIGVVLQVPSFFVSQADNFPAVSAFLAPQYRNAREGLGQLSKTGILAPGDRGFTEFQTIALEELKHDNEPTDLPMIPILAFRVGDSTISPTGQQRSLRLDLSNGQTADLDQTKFDESVGSLKSSHFLAYSSFFFVLGLMLECGGFYLERRGAEPN